MDKKLKNAWIKALKSGEWEQGREYLNNNGKLCCLGVLCEVAGVENKEKSKKKKLAILYDGDDKELSGNLLLEFGLKYEEMQGLIDMNDRERKTFKEIAEWIKENIPVVGKTSKFHAK